MLRAFRAEDLAASLAYQADAASARWVPAPPGGGGEEVAAYFEAARAAGELLELVIADAETDAYLGEVMLALGEHRVGELGCGLLPAARGRGIASRALRLVAEWSLSELGLARVEVVVACENDAALRLVARAGFHVEGTLRSYLELDGERLDARICSLLPEDLSR